MPIQLLIYGVLIVAAAGFGYGVVHNYNSAITRAETAEQRERETAAANQALERAAQAKEYNLQIERYQREQLQAKFDESRQQVDMLEKLFQEHEFDNLYDKKPGLILKRVNNGTSRVFSEFAQIINGTNQTEDRVRGTASD